MDAFDVNTNQFPDFAQARALEFDQLPGELLIIPTGWFHQVLLVSNVHVVMVIQNVSPTS